MKVALHDMDMRAFDGTWKKRARNEHQLRIVVGGTTYDPYDLLVRLKHRYSGGKLKKTKINKYTFTNLEETAVFVSVPKLDENDQLTFPQKTVLANVLQDRKNDYELFMAMDMQQPVPPKTNPFYWDNIQLYENIPTENRSEYCVASFDPTRKGYDNASMPIFVKVGDLYYFKDAIYEQDTPENIYKRVVEKVIVHRIVKLVVENNTDSDIKSTLEDMLAKAGVNYCEVIDEYSTTNKDQRIFEQSGTIRNRLVFPNKDIYSQYSEIGRFMLDIVGFAFGVTSKLSHDDAPDSVALFCDKIVNNNTPRYATVGTFRR